MLRMNWRSSSFVIQASSYVPFSTGTYALALHPKNPFALQ
jgi:hypothetical protein